MRALLVALLVLAAPASAYVASPVGEVGSIPAGVPVTFHVVAADDAGVPTVHADAPTRVLFDGQVLYETSQSGGHEYDGVHTFTVTFPRAGTYAVQATDGEGVLHEVTGTVTAHEEVKPVFAASDAAPFSYQVAVSPPLHTEALVRVVEEGRTTLRTELHDHGDGHAFDFVPHADGHVESLHSALQVPRESPSFTPFMHTVPFTADPPLLAPLGAPLPVVQPLNTVQVVEGDGMRLVATFDPYTQVGPDTLTRIAILALGPEDRPMPHTQFQATLEGPFGRVFASDSVHEHDGIWEFTTRRPVGTYALTVQATNGDASAQITATWNVVPPLAATAVGTQTVVLQTPDTWKDGEPAEVVARITDAKGTPFTHGEIEVEVRDGDGVPVLLTKVHSHDGVYAWTMALPAGTHTLHLDPYPLEARPVTFQGDLETTIEVGPAAPSLGVADDLSSQNVPGLYAATLLLGALSMALARRHT